MYIQVYMAHTSAKCTILPDGIVIGTVPLRESLRSFPVPQFQSVITDQPHSHPPPIYQPDSDNFDLRMSLLCHLLCSQELRLVVTVLRICL